MNTAPQQMELALMSREEAEAAVREVRQCARNVRVLLWELQCRRGWESMQYHSFDAFLLAEFDWSANYLHRQMRAAEVEDNIGCAIGTLPESHTRELFPLPTELRRAVWERVGGEEGLTAKRIKAVVAEVQVKAPELPGANGDEPPPGTMTASCRECGRTFSQELAAGAVASRVCPRCKAKAERAAPPGVPFQPPDDPHAHSAPSEGPTPLPEEKDTPDASSTHAEDDQGARRLEPTPPREGDLAAPPETTGVISGAETVWVREGAQERRELPSTSDLYGTGERFTPTVGTGDRANPPAHGIDREAGFRGATAGGGGEVAHSGAEGASRQAAPHPYCDPDDLPPTPSDPSDLAYLRAHGIPLDTALRLARKVVEAAGDGNPFRVVEEDAEVLRVVREISAKVDGGLSRLLRVMAQPGFLNWMNRHGRKAP